MCQVRCYSDFPQKPVGAERCGEIRAKDFYCHIALVFDVPRKINGGHTPATELALDLVAVLYRSF